MYKLVELFNTIQGEGSTQGLPVTLIRFKLCNLKCWFCDTQKIMALPEKDYTLKDITLLSNVSRNLLITGGEPTLYSADIVDLLYSIYTSNDAKIPYNVIFETNGSGVIDLMEKIHNTDPIERISKYTYSWSPKLYNQTVAAKEFALISKHAPFSNIEMKMVIDPNNYEIEKSFIETAMSAGFTKDRIWLMPMGAQYDELMTNLYPVIQLCHQMGVNLSPRLHIVFGKNLDKYLNKDIEV